MLRFYAYMQAPNYVVPWQTNKTFIIFPYLKKYIKIPTAFQICATLSHISRRYHLGIGFSMSSKIVRILLLSPIILSNSFGAKYFAQTIEVIALTEIYNANRRQNSSGIPPLKYPSICPFAYSGYFVSIPWVAYTIKIHRMPVDYQNLP